MSGRRSAKMGVNEREAIVLYECENDGEKEREKDSERAALVV